MGKEGMIFLLNEWMEQDDVLQRLFGENPLHLFPGFADEPLGELNSYPYIRYQFIPVMGRSMHVRKDWCQYFVGDVDLANVVNCIERIMYKLNSIEGRDIGKNIPDYSGKYKIHDIVVHTGSVPNSPSQDGGVWEQAVSFTVYYTQAIHDWAVPKRKNYSFDTIIA